MVHPGGTPVQGLNLYTIKGLGPRGRFYGPGARKTQKTKKLRKPRQEWTTPGEAREGLFFTQQGYFSLSRAIFHKKPKKQKKTQKGQTNTKKRVKKRKNQKKQKKTQKGKKIQKNA